MQTRDLSVIFRTTESVMHLDETLGRRLVTAEGGRLRIKPRNTVKAVYTSAAVPYQGPRQAQTCLGTEARLEAPPWGVPSAGPRPQTPAAAAETPEGAAAAEGSVGLRPGPRGPRYAAEPICSPAEPIAQGCKEERSGGGRRRR